MADMNAVVALQKAEKLVATVARAFYTDNIILVVDTLLREKYIKDSPEELSSRLNLQPKQVRAALTELLAEGLAAKEMMTDEIYSGRSSNYWYIDLRHAVNVILLRVYYLKEILSQRQEAKAARQVYVCPRCHEKFEVMDIYKLSNGDRSFCCSHCCPNDDHSDCKRDSGYTLEDFNDTRGLDSVTALMELLNTQLAKSPDPSVRRESIFDLIQALRDTVVPTNLPSQLRERGMGGQQRSDKSSAHARFEDDFHYRSRAADKAGVERGAGGSGSNGNGRSGTSNKSVQLLYTKNWRGEEVVVEIEQSEDEDEDEWAEDGGAALLPSRATLRRKAAAAAAKEERAAKRAKKALPTFLRGSTISGVSEGAGGGDGGEDSEDSSDESGQNGDDDAAAAAAAAAHARRLGLATVGSLEERDEMKKKLLPWTERMKQVWRKQLADGLAGVDGEDDGGEAWWEEEDGERRDSGAKPKKLANGGGGGGGFAGVGVSFKVDGRYVPMEAVTCEDAAKMAPEDYTRFYNLTLGQR